MTTTDQILEQPTADPASPPRPAQSAAAARVGGGVGPTEQGLALMRWLGERARAMALPASAAATHDTAIVSVRVGERVRQSVVGEGRRSVWLIEIDGETPAPCYLCGTSDGDVVPLCEYHKRVATEWTQREVAVFKARQAPTPAVADALARAEAAPRRIRQNAAAYASRLLEQRAAMNGLSASAHAEQAEHAFATMERDADALAQDVRALAGQLARAEGEREVAVRENEGTRAALALVADMIDDAAREDDDVLRAIAAHVTGTLMAQDAALAEEAPRCPNPECDGGRLRGAPNVGCAVCKGAALSAPLRAQGEPAGEVGRGSEDGGHSSPEWRWLHEMVQSGRGEVRFGITEDGDTGLFWDWWCDGEWTLGAGDTTEDAIASAMRYHPTPDAEPVVPPDTLSRWDAWRRANARAAAPVAAALITDARLLTDGDAIRRDIPIRNLADGETTKTVYRWQFDIAGDPQNPPTLRDAIRAALPARPSTPAAEIHNA